MSKPLLYIGLMSGTSADGIDLALVDFAEQQPKLIAKFYQAYDETTHHEITSLYTACSNEIERAFGLDSKLAHLFASAIKQFLKQVNLSPDDIIAIGNHGQTIRHRPQIANYQQDNQSTPNAFTLQIGCNQTLATLTNIRVVGHFRHKDMILGGQGAPLVPAFHQALFTEHDQISGDTFVVNIGGIANLTFLPANDHDKVVTGFDTGPGNALLDDWYQQHHSESRYDKNGDWGAQGQIHHELLMHLLSDEYFQLAAPKSTGREVFHLDWLNDKLSNYAIAPINVQATLTALTAQSICHEICKLSTSGKVFLCGGGVMNSFLKQLIAQKLTSETHQNSRFTLFTTNDVGVDSDALEAMAFAWFAYAFDHKIVGNIPAVTGATKAAVLGNNYLP